MECPQKLLSLNGLSEYKGLSLLMVYPRSRFTFWRAKEVKKNNQPNVLHRYIYMQKSVAVESYQKTKKKKKKNEDRLVVQTKLEIIQGQFSKFLVLYLICIDLKYSFSSLAFHLTLIDDTYNGSKRGPFTPFVSYYFLPSF